MERLHSVHIAAPNQPQPTEFSRKSSGEKRFFARIPFDFKNFAFAKLSGLLIFLSWPNHSVPFLLFFAFVPLLFSLVNVSGPDSRNAGFKAFFMVASAMLTWSLLSVFWLSGVALKMYLLAVFLQSLKVALPFLIFPWIMRRAGVKAALIYFICTMVLVEYVSQHSMFASPYFMLGYGLGEYPALIQVYRFIGIEGGTVWVLLVNVLIFYVLYQRKYRHLQRFIPALLVMGIPLLISLLLGAAKGSSGKVVKVVIHHSGRDPHVEEAYSDPVKRADELFEASFSSLSNDHQLVIWPETVLIRLGWLHGLENELIVQHLKERLKDYPGTTLILGGIGFSEASGDEAASRYARFVEDGQQSYYYNTHNVSIALRSDRRLLMRSKEQFIPFQERVPYLDELPVLENIVETVGLNTMFSAYRPSNRYFTDQTGNDYLPILCYESIFPVFTAGLCQEDVGAVIVQANEYWIPGSYGALQYFHTAVPLAIQSGKPILRSSNGGVSAIIDRNGSIMRKLEGRQDGNIAAKVNLSTIAAPYTAIAGYTYLLAGITTLLLFYYTIFKINTNIK